MNLVRQRSHKDCGVACAAIMADVPYREALRAVFGSQMAGYTEIHDLRAGLAKLNVQLGPKMVSLFGRPIKSIKTDALVKINECSNGYWHLVVWDVRGD